MKLTLAILATAVTVPAAAQVTPADPPLVRKLTEPQDDYPDVSPDGRHILFQSNRSGNWQLWLMSRDGSGLMRVAENAFNDRQPAWSPDGKWVAFSSDRGLSDGKRAIFIMPSPLAHTNEPPRQLTSGAGQDVHPKWLRDGSAMAFNRIAADGRQADVLLTTFEGKETRIDLGAGMNTYASVEPTGTYVVYRGTTREAGSNGPADNSDIFIAARNGAAKRRLTTDPAFDGWPAVSQDGRTIAFASRRGGSHFQLYLMPITGGEPQLVATAAGYHYTQPAWTPDGRSLIVYRWTQDRAGEVGHLVEVTLPGTQGS